MRIALALALLLPFTWAAVPTAHADDVDRQLERAIDRFMARFDADSDGVVTPAEYRDRARFARLDRSRDGVITRGDFYRALPPVEAMQDDPAQGPKCGGNPGQPPTGDAIWFCLMMEVTPETWARLRPYAKQGDLYWGENVQNIPARMRGYFTTGQVPEARDLISCAHVMFDGRGAKTPAEALAKSRKVKAAVDVINIKMAAKSGWKKRQTVGYYTLDQLAAEPKLASVADVILFGDASWTPKVILGKHATIKPKSYIGVVELAGRRAAIGLGTTPAHKHDADAVEKMIRSSVTGLKLNHLGFTCGDDRLHVLLDVLARVR